MADCPVGVTLDDLTPERVSEAAALLRYESSISFQSGRAHETMWLLQQAAADRQRLQRIVATVEAILEQVRADDAHEWNECAWADEHDCHATARSFLENVIHAALSGNDTALRVKEATRG